ncbi:MAG: TRAP transporter TatT component family protein [Gammaproteobacteria bacterium]|nr:TRAP transporter TatT component family protein [Gammaproteobacteria bacterium]
MFRLLVVFTLTMSLSACASLMNRATQRMADNLSNAMLNQNDLETVRAGSPAYLIMIDSLIEGDPDNPSTLVAGSKLYGSYASTFVEDEERAKRLADKSLDYARQALCLELETLCNSLQLKPDAVEAELAEVQPQDQPLLYGFASAWAGWLQINSDDWNAVAQIPKIKAFFSRSVELDETYDRGGAHLYLAVLSSQIPPSLGGKPEQGRAHFEKALELSAGKNLMVHVLYAEYYARLMFEQELHDRLLQQVLDSDTDEPGLTLINTLAQQRAAVLLAESSEFF